MKTVLVSKKDLVITWFSGGGGGGGQHKNKHDNCCRIHHAESGVTAQSTEHKSADQNKRQAFVNLTSHPMFKRWLSLRLIELRDNETVEDKVSRLMEPRNLKIEVIENGQWVEQV
jgi:protein subunit release factor B